MSDLSPRAYRVGLAAVLLAAAVAGFIRLAMPPVWLDEASSWYNVSGSWSHLWQRAVQGEDSGGLLYSILLKMWAGAAGTGEFALRLPGVVLWLFTIALLARAARLAWSRQAAVLAAAAALAHPSLLAAARQARSYILLLALTALVFAALAERLTGRSRRSTWLVAVASLAAAATHVMGIFVAIGAAACQALLDWREGRGVGRAALCALPALAFTTGWTVLIRGRVGRNLESFWIPGTIGSNYLAIGVLLVAPLAIACAWVLWRDRSPRARAAVAGLTAIAVPVALGPAIVSALAAEGTHLVQLRYAVPLVPLAAAAAGCALATLPRPLAAGLVTLALFISLPYSASKGVYAPLARGGQDVRGAAAFLAAAAKPGDTVLVEPPNNWMALAYYGVWTAPGGGRDGGLRVLTENGRRKTENWEGRTEGTENAKEKCKREKGKGEAAKGAGRTVWLVRFSQRTSAPPDLLARASLAGRFGTLTILEVAPY